MSKGVKVAIIVLVSILVLAIIYYFYSTSNNSAGEFKINRFTNQDNALTKTWVGLNSLSGGTIPYQTFKVNNIVTIKGSPYDGDYVILDIYQPERERDAAIAVKRIQIKNGIAGSGNETLVERVNGATLTLRKR
jgi:hypothetical protein